MKRTVWLSWAFVALLALPLGTARAQAFTGTGQQATELFELKSGLAVFEMEHSGAGRFAVRLLNERGAPVEELANQTGPFTGSRAVQVPASGRYLFDVTATGPWSVRLRGGAAAGSPELPGAGAPGTEASASPLFAQGEEAGAAAAAGRSSLGWLAGGFAGGTLAGPIGAAVAVALAGKSSAAVPDATRLDAGGDPLYSQGFERGFVDRLRRERRKRAIIGGIVGTGVFVVAVIQLFDINNQGSSSGGGTPQPPGPGISLQPHQ